MSIRLDFWTARSWRGPRNTGQLAARLYVNYRSLSRSSRSFVTIIRVSLFTLIGFVTLVYVWILNLRSFTNMSCSVAMIFSVDKVTNNSESPDLTFQMIIAFCESYIYVTPVNIWMPCKQSHFSHSLCLAHKRFFWLYIPLYFMLMLFQDLCQVWLSKFHRRAASSASENREAMFFGRKPVGNV